MARQNVMNRLANVSLPENVQPNVEPPYGPTGEIFRFTLESKTMGVRDLKTLEDWVVERNLKQVAGVADINSFGGETKTYEVSVDPQLLKKYGFTALDVYKAISNSNINVGGDVIEKSSQAYVVRGIGLINDLGELGNIVVSNINGTPILIRNVAQVHEAALARLGQVGRDYQNDAVEGIVVMRRGEDPKQVLEGVKAKIDELNNNILPAGVQIKTFYDRTDLVNNTTHTVMHNWFRASCWLRLYYSFSLPIGEPPSLFPLLFPLLCFLHLY